MTVLNLVLCLTVLCGVALGQVGIPGAPQPITDEAKLTELGHNVTTHLATLSTKPNGAQLGLHKVHSATSQVVAGTLYKIAAELIENNQNVNCTVSMWEKPWENYVKFDVECGDGEPKRTYGYVWLQPPDFEVHMDGAPEPITDEARLTKLADTFQTHLKKLVRPGGPLLEFHKIHSATSQVVAGILVEALADFTHNSERMNCTMKLWEKSWENFVKFDIKCGEAEYGYTDPPEGLTTTTEPAPEQLPILGGLSALSQEGIDRLHPRLVESFTQLSQKHENFKLTMKRIVSGQSQVVAGTRYVLTIEATNPENEMKQCEADVWEKSWEKFFRVKMTCEEKDYEIHL